MLLRLPKHSSKASAVTGQALVYAVSWWNEDTVNEYLQDKQLPIWASLSSSRTELYRDVQALYHGTSPFLERCSSADPSVSILAEIGDKGNQQDRCLAK